MTNIKIFLLLSLATYASYGDEEITDNLDNETETKIQKNEASDTTSPENKIIADLEIQTESGTAPSESKIIADLEIQTESGTASSENEIKAKIQAEPQEILILWDTIRGDRNYINEETFLTYYKDEEPNELSSVIKEFGHQYLFSQSDTQPEYIMYFDEFARAASQGYIQICSTQVMSKLL
ncbi:uncharacterized protein LOC126847704 [Adelges cooleyi]|uniref:uncharacterized protein LOC126847704 n=1 Tax=Adelges cooleyi TaxID=133065 RepID=UPI00217FDEBA|nr:uncharacterized protein LOC126847704 [Adelges cooleyi]